MKQIQHVIAFIFAPCLLALLSGCHAVGDKSMSVTVIYGATVVLSLMVLLAYFLLIRQKKLWFVLLFSSIPVINVGYQWLSVCQTVNAALWANRLSYLGSVFLPMAMLMIILNVTNLSYKRRLPWTLLGVAIAVFLIAASPGFSDIYYKEVSLETINGVTVLNKVYGALHPLYLFYLLGYFSAMIAAIIHATVKKKIASNAQAVVLAFAVFVNIAVWLFEQLSRIDFEFLSVSYIISELFLLGLDYVLQEHQILLSAPSLVSPVPSAEESPAVLSFNASQLECFTAGVSELTPTERMVFDLYLQGKTTKEVLATLNIRENTLKFHNKNIYSKLGVSSRKELRVLAKSLELC